MNNGGCTISSYTIAMDNGAGGSYTTLSSSISSSIFSYDITSGITIGLTYLY